MLFLHANIIKYSDIQFSSALANNHPLG